MRFTVVLLVSLLAMGWGTGSGNHDPALKISTFTPPSIVELLPNQVRYSNLNTVGLIPVFVRAAGLNSNTVDFDVTPQ